MTTGSVRSTVVHTQTLRRLLEKLTGQSIPPTRQVGLPKIQIGPGVKGLGHSQLNELLLMAGLDRITQGFFAYLLTGDPDYHPGMAFKSLKQLKDGIARFRTAALLAYGNVKFAFKNLSRDDTLLLDLIESLNPIEIESFKKRHSPLLRTETIDPEEAYLTGYLIESDLKERLKDPKDKVARALEKRRQEVVAIAIKNQAAYLASDHLDVYVATSMRARHEFISIGRTVRQIFSDQKVKPLKLRWFDPTQAYCKNRIDKGLAEALMLRRAACTIYLAQESDTLGKDSELASTLAQGKPVIAYVPRVDKKYFAAHIKSLMDAEPRKSRTQLLLDQLRVLDPGAAWADPEVRNWCDDPSSIDPTRLEARVRQRLESHYDSRAGTLMDRHPLGIQVNLGTGVANGVLVARTTQECAAIVRGILTRTLEFRLVDGSECTELRETISGSIFRVMTSDPMLTNTFWNFYLSPAE